MDLIDPVSGKVVWSDKSGAPMPPPPAGGSWLKRGDAKSVARKPEPSAFDMFLNGTGIPERVGLMNSMFNPVVGLQEAGQHSQDMLAPGKTGWERVGSLGGMLSGMAGTVAPMVAASKGAMPAADALMDGLAGYSAMPRAVAGEFMADEFGGLRLPMVKSDPAREAGDSILGLLKSGRASEVTDEMLDLGDPTLNTRLSEYLYQNYDLPMDAASRSGRGRDAGFALDTPLYRGDEKPDLRQFDTGLYAREGIGVTTSRSPNVAATYMLGDQPAMYPLVSRSKNPLTVEGGGRSWSGISPDAPANQSSLDNLMDSEDYLDEENFFDFTNGNTVDWGDGTSAQLAVANTNDISRAAQEYGFDEVRFNNIKDQGGAGQYHTGPASDPQTTVMTADPANIRSRFARFDPRLSHLKNLSAGVAGVAAMLGLAPDQAAAQPSPTKAAIRKMMRPQ